MSETRTLPVAYMNAATFNRAVDLLGPAPAGGAYDIQPAPEGVEVGLGEIFIPEFTDSDGNVHEAQTVDATDQQLAFGVLVADGARVVYDNLRVSSDEELAELRRQQEEQIASRLGFDSVEELRAAAEEVAAAAAEEAAAANDAEAIDVDSSIL